MNTLKLFDVLINLSCLALLIVVTVFVLSFIPINENIISEDERAPRIMINGTDILEENPILDKGKVLFRNNCASCHNRTMTDDMIGPALKGVTERWAKYPQEDLYNWIRNPQEMIAQNHPQAIILWNKWRPTNMTAYPNLKDEDIEAILVYIER